MQGRLEKTSDVFQALNHSRKVPSSAGQVPGSSHDAPGAALSSLPQDHQAHNPAADADFLTVKLFMPRHHPCVTQLRGVRHRNPAHSVRRSLN